MDVLNLICLGNVLGVTFLICLVYYVSELTAPLPSIVSNYYKPSQANTSTAARQNQVYPTAGAAKGSDEKKITPTAQGSGNSETNLYTVNTTAGGNSNDDDVDADVEALGNSLLKNTKPKTRSILSKRHIMSNNDDEYEYEALISETEMQNNKIWMKLSQDVLFVCRIVIILTTCIPIIVITAQL